MIVRTRGESLGVRHGLNLKEVTRTSRLVSSLTGYSVQPNKAVVGASAFAHERIHQHGVLANRATYEIMDPLEIGLEGNRIVLGKHSGRHAFADALEKVGISIDADHMNRAFARRKELADRKIQITEGPGRDRVRGGRQREGGRSRPRVPGLGRRHPPLADGDREAPPRRGADRGVGDGRRDDRRRLRRDPARRRRRGPPDHVQRVVGDRGYGRVGDVVVQLDIDGRRVTGRGVATDVVEASARVPRRDQPRSRLGRGCEVAAGATAPSTTREARRPRSTRGTRRYVERVGAP